LNCGFGSPFLHTGIEVPPKRGRPGFALRAITGEDLCAMPDDELIRKKNSNKSVTVTRVGDIEPVARIGSRPEGRIMIDGAYGYSYEE
jgi:hypothetical protein